MDKAFAWGSRASHLMDAMRWRTPKLLAVAVVSIFCALAVLVAVALEMAGTIRGTLGPQPHAAAGDEPAVEQVADESGSETWVRYFSAADGAVMCEVSADVARCAASTWRRTGLGLPRTCPSGQVAVAELSGSASVGCGAPVPFGGEVLADDVMIENSSHRCQVVGKEVECLRTDGQGSFRFGANSASMT